MIKEVIQELRLYTPFQETNVLVSRLVRSAGSKLNRASTHPLLIEMGSLTPQWSLDRSSSELFGVAQGIIQAATTDNVQPLALIACEKFGATLAMSPESCQKVQFLCGRIHESAVLSYLKFKIGYCKGDCGWYLAQSDAGLRFLGLVTCLSSMDSWQASLVLHQLISETATDKISVPTPYHLKQILMALQDRLAKSGFAESVVGWSHIFMDEYECSKHIRRMAMPRPSSIVSNGPPYNVVVWLTQAISRLARIGESLKRIEIQTEASHASWLTAFVKWCLGAPPAIVFHDGRSLVPEGDPRVVLRLLNGTGEVRGVRVDLVDYTGKIENLVQKVFPPIYFRGMVSVSTFGKRVMREYFGNRQAMDHRACVQALPYACALALRDLDVGATKHNREGEHVSNTEPLADISLQMGSETEMKKGKVLPSSAKVCRVLHDYLELIPEEFPQTLPELSEEFMVHHLHFVSLLKNDPSCDYERFISDLSQCVAHILAISLYNTADPSGLYLRIDRRLSTATISDRVNTILLGGRSQQLPVFCLLTFALELTGHFSDLEKGWVVSSYYDQTVFLQMFATQSIKHNEILTLECIPGMLIYQGRRHELVLSDRDCGEWYLPPIDAALDTSSRPQKLDPGAELTPRNGFSGVDVEWQLREQEYNLGTAVTIPKFPTIRARDPWAVIKSVVQSIFVNCSHDRMAKYTVPADSVIYVTTTLFPRSTNRPSKTITIVESDQNEQIRFFALASRRHAVVRLNSCIECCIKCAQKLKTHPWVVM